MRLDIGERIRFERKRRGRSLRSLADQAGLSTSALCRIEKGNQRVRADEVERLADALGLPVAELYADPPRVAEEKAS